MVESDLHPAGCESAVNVVIPIPSHDFDPSETAVSWKVLRDRGHVVRFATPDGQPGAADPVMLSGEGLDPWGFVPGLRRLRLIGLTLRANADARRAYAEMIRSGEFLQPLRHADLRVADFDGLLLPGGHAKGMRPYLESAVLQRFVGAFFDSGKPVAAICHGVLLAARATSPRSGRSALHGRRTTALTWALEKSAWSLTRFFARFWDPDYYRTYAEAPDQPAGYMSVQAEVTRALARAEDFADVPAGSPHHFTKSSGLFRDSADNERPAWVVRDGNYVSARWPGDVHRFAKVFCEVLEASPAA
ncbi:MAG: type 1 glutamine amidotransferase domain-containing protein [Sinimarinibacterium sp.]|jgi:putative intracellular protease/amidase